MTINDVSVEYHGGLLPDIIRLIKGYYHRGTRLNAVQRFYIQPMIPLQRFDTFPPVRGMLRRFIYIYGSN